MNGLYDSKMLSTMLRLLPGHFCCSLFARGGRLEEASARLWLKASRETKALVPEALWGGFLFDLRAVNFFYGASAWLKVVPRVCVTSSLFRSG
ncbi:hypothetical protein OPV22_031245 [Ensete ventricosum]|uniref:Uncharacterized protein n=1 Tax=Ensete ventricosum TaxID=4639 RepID=A0AAV8PIU6_ENSVE|nr:hypothetical protein OPV22_031245 [Ensete ventricosum]